MIERRAFAYLVGARGLQTFGGSIPKCLPERSREICGTCSHREKPEQSAYQALSVEAF